MNRNSKMGMAIAERVLFIEDKHVKSSLYITGDKIVNIPIGIKPKSEGEKIYLSLHVKRNKNI